MKIKNKKLYILIFIQVVLLGLIIWVIKKALYFFEMTLSRSNNSVFLKTIEKSKEYKILQSSEEALSKEIEEFLYTSKKETYYISSLHKDKIGLYGDAYVQKNKTNKWVIIVHGYYGKGEQMLSTAIQFYNKGYNTLLPDCRGHGKSEGKYISMGWHDRLDILAWINTLIKKDKDCEIILYGLSMGGAAVLMASGEDLPKNVKCIIEDSAYSSVYEEFSYHLTNKYKLPKFPILHLFEFICKIKAGFTLREASSIKQVRKCKIPILFIHGELDSLVPTFMVYNLFKETKSHKDILIIPNAGHGICACIGSDKYWNKIFDFISKYGK